MAQTVLFEKMDGVAVITLNRPERRNAINQDLLKNLYDRIDEVAASEDIRVAIITGSGPSFCSGLDLAVVKSDNLFDPRGDGSDLPDVFAKCGKPIIGAVNGHAITGGFELALTCDFLIASENASFADTHAKVGIHPGWGMTQHLQQAVGPRMAKQISFTCRFIPAGEALRIGLVNEVVAPDRLMPRAREIAGEIAAHNPRLLQAIKGLIDHRGRTALAPSFENERQGFRDFYRSMMSGGK